MRLSRRVGLGGFVTRGAELALWVKVAPAAIGLLLLLFLLAAIGGAYLESSRADCLDPDAAGEGAEMDGLPARAQRFAAGYLAAAERFRLGSRGPAILAAVHSVETDFGRLADVTSSAGAIGHFQFLPSSWRIFGADGDGDGRKDPYDFDDAVMGAAKHLRSSGGGDSASPGFWQRALFGYNHAQWYVEEVLAEAERFGDPGDFAVATSGCGGGEAGPADLHRSIRLYEPRAYKVLPKGVMALGRAAQPVDERIWPAAIWALREYEMAVTAAREPGHASHGDGTSLDLVPANGNSVAEWRRSIERFARDIGWRPGCGSDCAPPAIDAPAWVRWIGYNGDPSHGDPAHCSGGCAPHLHVSFQSDDGSEGALVPPDRWVMTFPAPGGETG
jgi:hypothetical protein